jgi:hypothetical protein
MTNGSAVSQPVSRDGAQGRSPTRTSIGIGLLVGAVGLVLVMWLFGDPGGVPLVAGEGGAGRFGPPLIVVLTWVFIAVWTMLLAYVGWRTRRTGSPTAGGGRRVGAVGLAGLCCLALLLVLLVVSGLYRAGRPGDQTSLTLVAAVAAAAGTLLATRGAEAPKTDLRTRRAVVSIAGGLAAVAIAASSVAILLSEVKHVDATTAEPGTAAPLPTSHLTEKWRWRTGEHLYSVVPAGTGAVVVTRSEITALDGATGAERWHYRRDDIDVVYRVVALDHGRTVVVTLRLDTGDENVDQHRAFDAFTGQELWQYSSAPYNDGPPQFLFEELSAGTTTLISKDDNGDETPHVVRDSRTGNVLWRWTLPPECSPNVRPQDTADVVLVPLACGDDHHARGVLALDARTGAELWRQDNATNVTPNSTLSSNGTVILANPDDLQDRGRFVDARTGRETAPNPGFTEFYADPNSPAVAGDLAYGGRWEFGLLQPGAGMRWTVDHTQFTVPSVSEQHALAFLPDSVALVKHEYASGNDKSGYGQSRDQMVLLDRNTGAELRDLHSTPWYDVKGSTANKVNLSVFAAPGTLIAVRAPNSNPYLAMPTELIGFG